jgi:hypothetical protein
MVDERGGEQTPLGELLVAAHDVRCTALGRKR